MRIGTSKSQEGVCDSSEDGKGELKMPILNLNPPRFGRTIEYGPSSTSTSICRLVGRRVTTASNSLRVVEFVDAGMTSSGPTGIGLIDFVPLSSVRDASGVMQGSD